MKSEINQRLLLDLVAYDPASGRFMWKSRDMRFFNFKHTQLGWNARFAGSRADRLHVQSGYMKIKIFQKYYSAHRLAWLYVNGSFPEFEIDHIDGDTCNNRIINLRDVTHEINSKNRKIRSNNKTGIAGVYFHKASQRWEANISKGRRQIVIGYFVDYFEAVCARKSAENISDYHENHGRKSARIC